MENMDYDLRSVQEVRNLARKGQIATERLATYTEEQIDRIIRNMVRVAEENAVSLAQMAVEETGFGKVADKTYKNHMASTLLYDAIKDMKTGAVTETGLPASNVLYYDLTDDAWLCVRPSGTEPKVKFYYGVKGTSLEDADAKSAALGKQVVAMIQEML